MPANRKESLCVLASLRSAVQHRLNRCPKPRGSSIRNIDGMNLRHWIRITLEAKVRFGQLFFLSVILQFMSIPAHGQAPVQGERPLPALDEFIKEVRQHLRSDRMLLSQYTYTETDTVKELDRKGKQKSTHEIIYEVYPSYEPDLTYRRLIAKDGKPTDPKDLEKEDGKHDKKLKEYAKKLEREGTGERERRQAKEAEANRKEETAIEEMFRIYGIKMEGRDLLDEQPAIILSFRPRSGYKPKTDEGKILAKLGGRAWFNEQDHELARIEVKLIDNISLGWGLLARINRGAEGVLRRQKINGEIWLPVEVHFIGSARILLVKGMNVDFSGRYSDFLKFTVETQVRFRKD